MDIIRKAEELAEAHGGKLLYLCKFGSHLYGTNTPTSDTDYKGIFLPSLDSLLMGQMPKSISWKTGTDQGKNGHDDIDLELWSLQYWLDKLVRQGDTNGLDLMFSPSHAACIMYCHGLMSLNIFQNPLKFFRPSDCKAYIGYAIGQARKYGIKGSRLGAVKRVKEWLDDNRYSIRKGGTQSGRWRDEDRLDFWLGEIIKQRGHEPYCSQKEINDEPSLVLCGKVHMGGIRMEELYARVNREYERYGERARAAEKGEGIDWKALSHALRAIFQMKELLYSGNIQFPLLFAPGLTAVKQGRLSWKEVQEEILFGLEDIDRIQTTTREFSDTYDKNAAKATIRLFYNMLDMEASKWAA